MIEYYEATVLTKGKKEKYGFYAKSIKEANDIAKIKYSGVLIKVNVVTEPLELQFQRFKTKFLQNIKKRKIKPDALISAIRQLAVMTNAGISIHDSIAEVANSTGDEALEFVFTKLAEDIDSGKSLSLSMEAYRYELGNLTIAMVKLGEKTGNLDESLNSLAEMLDQIRENFVKFKKAMAYPRNVMIAMAVAFTVLIAFVVPQFKSIFAQLGAELPLPTLILLQLEDIFSNYGLFVLFGGAILFFFLKYSIENNKNVEYSWHTFLLKTYLIKNIIKFSTLNRFTLVFSELVKAGIPIAEALDTSIDMIDNLPLKKKLQTVRIAVEKGSTLNIGLKDTNLFENMIIQMVKAGEDGGALDKMMQKVADFYKTKFDAIIDGLSSAIEPIMLVIIAAMVTLLALGIFMPMWNMGAAAGAM